VPAAAVPPLIATSHCAGRCYWWGSLGSSTTPGTGRPATCGRRSFRSRGGVRLRHGRPLQGRRRRLLGRSLSPHAQALCGSGSWQRDLTWRRRSMMAASRRGLREPGGALKQRWAARHLGASWSRVPDLVWAGPIWAWRASYPPPPGVGGQPWATALHWCLPGQNHGGAARRNCLHHGGPWLLRSLCFCRSRLFASQP
jgi:hypothetical protein